MAKIDRIKEEIGWLKVIFAALVAIDASLIGWLTQNYSTATMATVIGAIVAATVAMVGIVLLQFLVYSRLEKLENA